MKKISPSQRMSDDMFSRIKLDVKKHGFNTTTERLLFSGLCGERARVDDLKAGLRSCDCPLPAMTDRTIGACVDAGICGCVHSTQLKPAQEPKE